MELNQLYPEPTPTPDPVDNGDVKPFVQPMAHTTYFIGDRVLFNGKIYESLIDRNAWSPSDYPRGWSEVDGTEPTPEPEPDPEPTPVAANPDSATVNENTEKLISVLSNDTGDKVSIVSVTQPTNGTAMVSEDKILYIPAENYLGNDSFEYTIEDSNGVTAAGLVTLVIKRFYYDR